MAVVNAEDIKNKAAETMSNAKEKVEAIASDKRVQSAKASVLKFISDAKLWIVVNWNAPGWHGKAKVAAAIIVTFFFCRGVFCGWGTSNLEKELAAMKAQQIESDAEHAKALHEARDDKELREAEAAAHLLGALFGGGGIGGNQPKRHYMCKRCGNQVDSSSWPTGFSCPMAAGRRNCDWKEVR